MPGEGSCTGTGQGALCTMWRGDWLGLSEYKYCEEGVCLGGAVLKGTRAPWRND